MSFRQYIKIITTRRSVVLEETATPEELSIEVTKELQNEYHLTINWGDKKTSQLVLTQNQLQAFAEGLLNITKVGS